MKTFLIRLLIVAILPVSFLVFIEIAYSKIPNSYSYKADLLEQQMDSIETLILGPSLIRRGIDPSLLNSTKSFNMSFPSQSLQYSCMLIEHYAKQGFLSNVIVSVNYHDFRKTIEDKAPQRIAYYHNQWGNHYRALFIEYNRGIEMLNAIKNYHLNKTEPKFDILYNGFEPFSPKQEAKGFQDIGRKVKNETASYSKKVELNKSYLKKIIDVCKENNIQLILVTTPLHESTIPIRVTEQTEEFINYSTTFADQNPHVYYYNFLNDGRFIHNKDYFMDSIHLNTKGAEKFSKLLNEIFLNDGIFS